MLIVVPRGSGRAPCSLGSRPILSKRAHCRSSRDGGVRVGVGVAVEMDELGERSHDLRGRLLRQVKQGHHRAIARYRVLMQAATIRRGRRRRWLLLWDSRGHEFGGAPRTRASTKAGLAVADGASLANRQTACLG